MGHASSANASLQCWVSPTKDKQVPVPPCVNIRGDAPFLCVNDPVVCLSERRHVPRQNMQYVTTPASEGRLEQLFSLPFVLGVFVSKDGKIPKMETANSSQTPDGPMASVRLGTCFCFLGLGFFSAFLHWPAGFPHFCSF